MMIIGIGSDLCNIERIQNSLDRWGDRFLNRVFTEVERRKAASRPHTIAGTLAKRFAAKEAFSKAVGTGFKRGVFMKDIGVVNLPSGQPTLELTGGARARLDALVALPRRLARAGARSAPEALPLAIAARHGREVVEADLFRGHCLTPRRAPPRRGGAPA